jgi:hypothetical protein
MATVMASSRSRSTYNASMLWALIPPGLIALIAPTVPPVVAAWLLAVAIFAMFKIWTFLHYARTADVSMANSLAYLLAWPGMDPRAFSLRVEPIKRPTRFDWLSAGGETLLGATLLWVVVRRFVDYPLLAGWIGLVGLAFFLHFGLFHLLALVWRWAGAGVEPLMKAPILASSVSDFWSHRWNLAFRDLAQVFFFRPFVSQFGVSGATMIVFAMSGLIHDVVISIPSRGGHGWPSLYFLVQGVAVLVEKSKFGRRIGLGRGAVGRLFGWIIIVPGAFWLFHPPFVREVILPTLSFIHAY